MQDRNQEISSSPPSSKAVSFCTLKYLFFKMKKICNPYLESNLVLACNLILAFPLEWPLIAFFKNHRLEVLNQTPACHNHAIPFRASPLNLLSGYFSSGQESDCSRVRGHRHQDIQLVIHSAGDGWGGGPSCSVVPHSLGQAFW